MDLSEQRRAVEASFRFNIHPDDAPRHPLYSALCVRASNSPDVIDMMLEVQPTQRRAVLLLAVLHDVALSDPTGPLAAHYPTAALLAELDATGDNVRARARAEQLVVGSQDADVILDFALDHRDDVIAAMRARRTQTNEVGRSGLLMLGLQLIGRGKPTALIDLGCSAGLNTMAPSYHHVRSDGVALGDASSAVVVPVEVTSGSGPTAPVDLVWSAGIDLDPVDLGDPTAARWLLACQWPDDLERFERTRHAIDQWRAPGQRPSILRGDLVSSLPKLVEAAPADALLVLHHSWVASYLPIDEQQALRTAIHRLRDTRPISWLYLEHPREVPGLSPPRSTGPRQRGASLLVLERDSEPPRVIGQAHPHGRWIALDEDLR